MANDKVNPTFLFNFQTDAVATGNGTAFQVGGLAGVLVQITGITTATITFEGTVDGTNWVSLLAFNQTTGASGTTATANGLYQVFTGGVDKMRCRVSAWTAGTIDVIGKGVPAMWPLGAITTAAAASSLASEITDDAAFTPGTSKVAMVGFTFDDVAPDSVNEGDGGAARMSANRNVYMQVRDAAGNERGLNVDASGNIGTTSPAGPSAAQTIRSYNGSQATSTSATTSVALGTVPGGKTAYITSVVISTSALTPIDWSVHAAAVSITQGYVVADGAMTPQWGAGQGKPSATTGQALTLELGQTSGGAETVKYTINTVEE